jgi:GNAT superfamily N-acetyltransferase
LLASAPGAGNVVVEETAHTMSPPEHDQPHAATTVVYHLEMTRPDDLRPTAGSAGEFELRRVEIPCPEFNRFLCLAVGSDYRWVSRNAWGREQWAEFVDRPELETWVAYVRGTPAGYFELERQQDDSVKIVLFGLLPQFIGRGLGGAMLTHAVQRSWAMGASRVWLTTCTHDHPNALPNYLARGFKLVNQTTRPADPPLSAPQV